MAKLQITGEKHGAVLVLAPHTDDGEIGCGGTISKLTRMGKVVYYVAFSTCEKTLPEGFPPGTLGEEVKRAVAKLGLPPERLITLDYDVRCFADRRQDILDHLVGLKNKYNPELVLCPSINDLHQDHETVAREAQRAFKDRTILCYEMPWNNVTFNTRCFVRLEKRDLDAKLAALAEYESQANRAYLSPEFITSLARVRGTSLKVEFAEAFDVVRLIL